MGSVRIRFFDVDHTIVRSSTGRRFAQTAFRRGVLRFGFLTAIPLVYLRYRLGKPEVPLPGTEIAALKGLPRDLLEDLAKDAYRTLIAPDVFPEARRMIAAFLAAGDRVVLATSSFDFMVGPLADDLGVSDVIASSVEFRDDVSTGSVVGDLVFGRAKLDRARAHAESLGFSLADCSFYSDSIHDLPLLLAVGRPVAVNPDRRLAVLARSRGWEELRFLHYPRRP
jgi:HAD superfamily hydrolase (TIGR01490 family)